MTKLRCLLPRKDPEISIEVELSERVETNPVWRYTLSFRSEGTGRQRVVVSKEQVVDLTSGSLLLELTRF